MDASNLYAKAAIIGLGKIGSAIAANLIKGDHPVTLASRDYEKAKSLASQLGELASAKDTSAAILDAEIIIPAISFHNLAPFFKAYQKELQGKIIVDVSNPIATSANGGFKKIIGERESAAKILSAQIPETSKLVKAFGTLGAGTLLSESFQKPNKKVLFYASDSTNSNQKIEQLITGSGFAPFHIGGIDQAIRIEVFGDLHEYGELGKTVTLSEAKSKVNKQYNNKN